MLGEHLWNLDKVLLDRSGDGFKNYFSFAWQYKYEGGYWFDGMQYPYGDLLGFADGQPAIAMLLIGLKKIGLDFSGNELLLVQGLPILGVFIGAIFLHKIVRSFQLPQWWSVLTVLACIALSPQVYRFNSHFALAYMFCFPSIWYILILEERNRTRGIFYALILFLLLLVFAFIHPYHLLTGVIFLTAYFLVRAVRKDFSWHILLAALSSIGIYMLIHYFIDPMQDRPRNPWGAWYYKAEVGDLLPFYGWYISLVGDSFARQKYHEGYSYLGILFFAIPYLIFKRKQISAYVAVNSVKIKDYLFAGLLCLLFAMGIHILITDHKILEWISSLKQFRALGRFSWPFYYVAFVSLSVMFYRANMSLKSKGLAWVLFLFVAGMWTVDSYSFLNYFNERMNEYTSVNRLYTERVVQKALDDANVSVEDFQAILPIPVSMEGAEKLRTYMSYFPKTQGIPFAFQNHIPLIGAHMSRTSLSRILKQYQLGSSAYVEKKAISDFPNRKDVLMIMEPKDSLLYKDLAARGTLIGHTKHSSIYRMSMDSLERQQYIHLNALKDSKPALFYSDFTQENETGLASEGFKILNGSNELCNIRLDSLAGEKLMCSFWMRVDADKSSRPSVDLRIKNSEDKQIKHVHYSDMDMKRCEVIGNWIQIKKEVLIPEEAHAFAWHISAENLAIDHALVTQQGEGRFWKKLNENFVLFDHYIAEHK